MILGVFTELLAVGGIQRAGCHAAAALAELAAERREPCRILSLNDHGVRRVRVEGVWIGVQGFGGSKPRLLWAVLPAVLRARLVLLGHPRLAVLGLLRRVLRPRGPCWVCAHGLEVSEPLALPHRTGLRLATGVLAVSRYVERMVVEVQRVPAARVHVLYNALPGTAHTVRGSAPAAREEALLLTVGRLAAREGHKGIDTVIRALPRVAERVPAVRYLVIGDGDDRARLERLAADTGVRDRVEFAGHVPEDELARAYERCRVFVMTSAQEGFGIVYLEAMSFGRPVVAARNGGAPEVVLDGVTGRLVEYGDAAALADVLAALLDDPVACGRMGLAGRRRVHQHFTYRGFAERLRALLLPDAVGRPRAPARPAVIAER